MGERDEFRLAACHPAVVFSWSRMRPHSVRFSLIVGLALFIVPVVAFSQVAVIFTRHAEKGATPPKDPPLTEAGQKRAEVLGSMLADSGVDTIYVTEFRRTQQTAAPLAARVHVKPTVIAANDTEGLVNAIRARTSGVVVVVGHSNTLPAIVAALGGPAIKIADNEYDNLFVLTVGAAQSSLVRMHYGSSEPAPPAGKKMEPMTPGGPVK